MRTPASARRGGDSNRPPPPRPWGRARGTFPAWSPAKEARSRAEGAGGPRSGRRETRGASGWGQGRKGKARGKRERSDQTSRDVLWTSEESRRRRPLVSHGEVTGMGNGGPAGKVGANGQPWEAERPASYADGSEVGRVWKVCGGGGAFDPSPSPIFSSPRGPSFSLHSAPSRGEKVWVQPSPRALIRTELGKEEGIYRPPQPFPSQPLSFLFTFPPIWI